MRSQGWGVASGLGSNWGSFELPALSLTHHAASAILLTVTVYLLLTAPPDRNPLETLEHPGFLIRPCAKGSWGSSCPNGCAGHGDCVKGGCQCRDGFVGADCSFEACPNNCTNRGSCTRGYCVCTAQYGGADCSVDRLTVLTKSLMDGIDFKLTFPNSCPFLTKEDCNRHGGNETRFWSDVMSKEQSYQVPKDLYQVLPDKCPTITPKTCGVVGNSGTLRWGTLGAEIDAHDLIYRFNQGPTEGYESHVGTLTSVESLNAKFAHALARADEGEWLWRETTTGYILFEPWKLRDTYVTIRHKNPEIRLWMFAPEFVVQAHRIYDRLQDNLEREEFGCFTGEKPMSGFYAALWLLYTCESVDLYGFVPWTDSMSHGGGWRYHYFDGEEPRRGAHSFDATYFMYQLMSITHPEFVLHEIAPPPNLGKEEEGQELADVEDEGKEEGGDEDQDNTDGQQDGEGTIRHVSKRREPDEVDDEAADRKPDRLADITTAEDVVDENEEEEEDTEVDENGDGDGDGDGHGNDNKDRRADNIDAEEDEHDAANNNNDDDDDDDAAAINKSNAGIHRETKGDTRGDGDGVEVEDVASGTVREEQEHEGSLIKTLVLAKHEEVEAIDSNRATNEALDASNHQPHEEKTAAHARVDNGIAYQTTNAQQNEQRGSSSSTDRSETGQGSGGYRANTARAGSTQTQHSYQSVHQGQTVLRKSGIQDAQERATRYSTQKGIQVDTRSKGSGSSSTLNHQESGSDERKRNPYKSRYGNRMRT